MLQIWCLKKHTNRITCLILKWKRFLPYIIFSLGLSYSTAYNSNSYCGRGKLFAVWKWSINSLLDTCYFNQKYVLRSISNETFQQNINDFIGCIWKYNVKDTIMVLNNFYKHQCLQGNDCSSILYDCLPNLDSSSTTSTAFNYIFCYFLIEG